MRVQGTALVVLALAACVPAEAPWTRAVPDTVPRMVYERIAEPDRRGTVRLVRDLVIGDAEGEDFNYVLGGRAHVSADEAGVMFVVDPMNQRVQVFDPSGEYVRTLGRAGEGPGEFAFPLAAAVSGSRVFIFDSQRSRMSLWERTGELVWDRAANLFPGYLVAPTVGLADGSWLSRFRNPRVEGMEFVAHLSSEGERIAEIAPLRVPERVSYNRHMLFVGAAPPHYATDAEGHIYVSPLEEYQVFAYRPDGSMRWALQRPAERSPLTDQERDWAVGWFGRYYPAVRESQIEWPERSYALADLKVDGQGRVYVFPYFPRGATTDRLAVDIYDRDGSPILSGWLEGDLDGLYWAGDWKPGPMLATLWQTARGDHIYGVMIDNDTGVERVVRHRLEFPAVEQPLPDVSMWSVHPPSVRAGHVRSSSIGWESTG